MSFTAAEYEEMALIAYDEIQVGGRVITLTKNDNAAPAPAAPWLPASGDPIVTTVETKGISVAVSDIVKLGHTTFNEDLLKRADKIFIVAPGTAITEDLALFNKLDDTGVSHSIIGVETLRPGDAKLLYYVMVGR